MSQDKIELTLDARTIVGKQVRQLRTEGVIPAVIHDHGKDSVLVQGDTQTILKAYKQAGKNHPVALQAAGKKYNAMIKSVEFEPKKHNLRHVVFNAVSANEKVEAEVPVRPKYAEGNDASPAERSGMLVLTNLTTVVVEAISTKLPEVLEYDAEKLVEDGDTLTVADLHLPAGVEMITDLSHALATVTSPAAIAASNDAAGGDAPADQTETATENGSADDDADSQAAEDKPGGQAQNQPKGE